MTSQEQLLDVKYVANALGVSEQWLYEQTRLNEFPHVRIGRLLRFRRSDVDHYIASRTRDGLGFREKGARTRSRRADV